MKGFYGRYLIVNLAAKGCRIEFLSAAFFERYLGGKGLASYLLLQLNPEAVDPLEPENCLVFATGPVTQSSVWGSCRYGVFTKSPQTLLYSESYSGGKTPEAIDATGFDAIVIKGCAHVPTVLLISPEGVEFLEAGHVWGMDTFEAQKTVFKELAPDVTKSGKRGAVVIGPAGENLVRFAAIENDYWRSAGRTGVGAVMGSKKLKAIVFFGDRRREVFNGPALNEYSKQFVQKHKDGRAAKVYKSLGTPMMVDLMNNVGGFPTRYWSQGRCEHARSINADALHNRCDVKPHACTKCFLACGRMSTVLGGRHKGLKIEGPEYETIYAFGGLCLVKEIEEVIYLNDLCDRLGMDTISAGNMCALAIEAGIRGRIPHVLDYGDVNGIGNLLLDIAHRRGIGETLALGIRHAAQEWRMEDVAIHVKGLEPPGYDPRVLKGMGLAYAISDRGACHLRATIYKPELSGEIDAETVRGKAEILVDYEDRHTIFDSLIFCRFYRDLYPWEELEEIVSLVTGVHWNKDRLQGLASRVTDLTRQFNKRESLSLEDDCLPSRFYVETLPTGQKITKDELEFMKSEYYRLRGWK